MGAVSSLVTGAYGTMCECFFIGLLLNHPCFAGLFYRFFVNLYKEYSCLKLRDLEESPYWG